MLLIVQTISSRRLRSFIDVLMCVARCLTIVAILFTQVDIAFTTVTVAMNIERSSRRCYTYLPVSNTRKITRLLSAATSVRERSISIFYLTITRNNYRLLPSVIYSLPFSLLHHKMLVQSYPFHLRNSRGKLKITKSPEGKKL